MSEPTVSPDVWLPLLRQCVEEHEGNKAKAAIRLGISRAAVSTLLRGCYPSPNTEKVGAKIIERMARVECPHSLQFIPMFECRQNRERDCPTNDALQVRFWRTCQTCQHNPKRQSIPIQEAE
jgi:hypothetical protein